MSERVPKPDQKTVDRLIAKASKEKGYDVCGYWKRTGGVCMRAKAKGRNRCSLKSHGGKAPRGVNHPNTTHGGRSKDLPTYLKARWEQGRQSSSLYEMRDMIALSDAMHWDLVSKLDDVAPGELWKALKQQRKKALAAIRAGNQSALDMASDEILRLIGVGASEHEKREEIRRVQDHHAKLLEQNRKLLREEQQTLTVEQVLLLTHFLTVQIKRYVDDDFIRKYGAAAAREKIADRIDDAVITGTFERDSNEEDD